MHKDAFGHSVNLPPDPRSRVPHEAFVLPECMIGIELEYELFPVKQEDRERWFWWNVIEDGSLRGPNAHELVLAHPLSGKDLYSAISQVTDDIANNVVKTPTPSRRTSTHVHIDIRDMTADQINRLVAVTCAVEEILFEYCGEGRKDSFYCTPMSGSSTLREKLSRAYPKYPIGTDEKNQLLRGVANRHEKYTALNLAVAINLGSVEYRHMRALHTKQEILDWVNIIQSIKKYSVENTWDVAQLPTLFSCVGPTGFLRAVFGDLAETLLSRCTELDVNAALYRGIRCAQDIVYSYALTLAGYEVLTSCSSMAVNPAWVDRIGGHDPKGLEEVYRRQGSLSPYYSPHMGTHYQPHMSGLNLYKSEILGMVSDVISEGSKPAPQYSTLGTSHVFMDFDTTPADLTDTDPEGA